MTILGLINATFNSPCVDGSGNPQPGFTDPSQCAAAGLVSNDPSVGGSFNSVLLPYDLTRSGSLYAYFGHADIKELALYVQDQIKAGNWVFNLGIRGDLYNGLTVTRQPEPRAWARPTALSRPTLFCASRMHERLRLHLTKTWCFRAPDVRMKCLHRCLRVHLAFQGPCSPASAMSSMLDCSRRSARTFVISGDYIWKYTHNAFDFSIFGNTPIFFPIDWHNSKIPGYVIRADVPNYHHFSAFVVMSSVAARFFPPQSCRCGCNGGTTRAPLPHRS